MIVEIKVVPSSGRQQCSLDTSGTLKCYLKSPPERGLANEELIGLFSKALRIPKSEITIIAGATGRKKMLRIQRALTMPEILGALGVEVQQMLWKKPQN